MRFFLIINKNEYDLTGRNAWRLGNAHGNADIPIKDKFVSRQQAIIFIPDYHKREDQYIFLVDGDGFFPSRNGTFFRGRCLKADSENENEKGVKLFNGDFFTVGKTTVKVVGKELSIDDKRNWGKETSGF